MSDGLFMFSCYVVLSVSFVSLCSLFPKNISCCCFIVSLSLFGCPCIFWCDYPLSGEDIVDLELDVVDTQPATIAGAYGEFIFSPRLDNLMSCFCALESMLSPTSEDSISQDNDVRVIAFFDNEEVGSDSNAGAGSTLLKDFFHRFSETQPLETGSSCPEVCSCLIFVSLSPYCSHFSGLVLSTERDDM